MFIRFENDSNKLVIWFEYDLWVMILWNLQIGQYHK